MKDYRRDSNPILHRSDLEDNPVEKLTNKEDCARLFEFDNDAPLIMENKDYREIIGLNRGTDDSRRTFAKPQSPDYMHDSGIGNYASRERTIKSVLDLVNVDILGSKLDNAGNETNSVRCGDAHSSAYVTVACVRVDLPLWTFSNPTSTF